MYGILKEVPMNIPNWQHHSTKLQKRSLKPQALRAAKRRTKVLIKYLLSQSHA